MRFVIIAAPRTGSNHLVTELGREREIWCHGEVFHPNRVFVRWPGWPQVEAPDPVEARMRALRASDPAAFLDHIHGLGFDRPHVGLKIFERHHPPMLARMIDDFATAKIVLMRTNVLANYASALVARQADAWGVINPERRAAVPPVAFVARDFLAHHDRYMSFYARVLARLNDAGQSFQLVRYDELNNAAMMRRVVRFLGATPDPGPSPAPDPVRGCSDILSRVSNPGAARAFIKAHGRPQWAYEGEVDFTPLVAPPASSAASAGARVAGV